MDKELEQAIWKFNFRPDSYVHESWLKLMPEGEILAKLIQQRSNSRAYGNVAWYVLSRLGLADNVFFDFSKPLTRIVLWPSKDIEQLVLYIGAVFHAKLLSKIIQRDDLIKIQRLLGDELFSFMQQRAPAIGHKVSMTLALPSELSLKQRIILVGLLCLRAALHVYPDTVWKRLMFKLDRAWYVDWKQHAKLGSPFMEQADECSVLIQKVAIDIRMGVNRDGKILFG